MHQLLSSNRNFNFMGRRRLALAVSGVLIVVSLVSLLLRGLSFGIDFTGGTLIEVGYEQAVELEQVRRVLAENGFEEAQVQQFGTPQDLLIRLAPREGVKSS